MSSFDSSLARMVNRPDAERFASLDRAADRAAELRAPMRTTTVYAPQLRVEAAERGLYLPDLPGAPSLTYSSLRQFAPIVAGPGLDFLDDLPPQAAAQVLNLAIEHRSKKKIGSSKRHSFYFRPGGPEDLGEVKSVNGPEYNRVYDDEVLRAAQRFVADSGRTWECPLPFNAGTATDDRQGTIFVGDTFSYAFLSNPDRPIDLPGGNGSGGTRLNRMVILENSETGHGKLRARFGTYSYICSNYNIWGLAQDQEFEAIHRGGAATAMMEKLLPALLEWSDASDAPIIAAVAAARGMFPYVKAASQKDQATEAARQPEKSVADLAEDWLKKQSTAFTAPLASSAVTLAMQDSRSGSDGRLSLWDLVQGVTRAAQVIRHRDDRLRVEVAAGKLMAPAVAAATK